MENLVGRRQYENRARRTWWSVHIEAWRKSGLSRRSYCRQHRLDQGTFARWLSVLVDVEALKVQAELKREQRRLSRPRKLSTDMRSRAVQAYWAMHVEAMTWSGMSVRAYAKAHGLSRFALQRWRDLIEANEVDVDWRAQLHPSARAQISTSASSAAKESGVEKRLTDASSDVPSVDGRSNRRRFSDEEKLAIARESDAPNASAAEICRRHGIVSSMLFRWRVQFGFGRRARMKLARVEVANATSEGPLPLVLLDLLQPPDGMVAVELADGRRVFAPADADPDVVRRHVADREIAS
ncbi:IS66 family insertion sequence element accessory protein TnpA [Bradyrhizobium elkanii]|uniref:IS66 family insertion sequence element accessory protein TnpA n=1 Tax=Bradyrhizobium elkanii TaxID=29448 RepID=UPI0008418BEF|nr:transposase [Bradyrhizobium elkanii]ODM82245.1 transposase [Bradyrhizobium elkanii]ODM85353.1 transposase [Bradyrhizobium elkanii]